jgi:hypothetical protein
MNPLLFCAIGTVRAWTRFYTLYMDPADRDRRRAEIDSDLWEFHEDTRRRRCAPATIATLMLMRLLLGVAHDVIWRIEYEGDASGRRSTWMTAGAIGATVCIAALWAFFAATSIGALPPLPDLVHVERVYRTPPPPPPPPPGAGMRVTIGLMPPPPPPPPPK